MKRNIVFIIILIVGLITACDESTKVYLPGYSGRSGEVIVVMDTRLWNGETGEIVQDFLEESVLMLPQAEPYFDIIHLHPKDFSRVFRSHRNILMITFDSDTLDSKTKIEVGRDRWASHQLVIQAKSGNLQNLKTSLKNNGERIVELFNEIERERIVDKWMKRQNESEVAKLKEEHNLFLAIPSDAHIAKQEDNFIWIKRDRVHFKGSSKHDVNQGIFIYFFPYESDSLFERQSIVQRRDNLLKRYVPGPSEGSYMQTFFEEEFDVFYPVANEVNFRGNYGVELRGLWNVHNDYMGGPFISLTTYDTLNNRLVGIEGYVFAPRFDKREYLREVEGVIYSAKFIQEEKES